MQFEVLKWETLTTHSNTYARVKKCHKLNSLINLAFLRQLSECMNLEKESQILKHLVQLQIFLM